MDWKKIHEYLFDKSDRPLTLNEIGFAAVGGVCLFLALSCAVVLIASI